MDLKTFITTWGLPAAESVFTDAGSKPTWISQIKHDHRRVGALMARRLNKSAVKLGYVTVEGDTLTPEGLRPDIFG
jgi:hypothetical protein